MAVKGTQGAIMAGGALSNTIHEGKEKISKMMPDANEESQQMYQQLFNEIKTEREQLQVLVSEINNIKEHINLNDNIQEPPTDQ